MIDRDAVSTDARGVPDSVAALLLAAGRGFAAGMELASVAGDTVGSEHEPPEVNMRSILALSLSLGIAVSAGCIINGPDTFDPADTIEPPGAGGDESVFGDDDQDGFVDSAEGGDDCNDSDAQVHPGAPDEVGDGIDQNCDGTDGVDADGDGYASELSGGSDCNDADDKVHPGAGDSPGGLTTKSIYVEKEDKFGGVDTSRVAVGSDGSVHVVMRDPYLMKNSNTVRHRAWYGTSELGQWTWQLLGEPSLASAPVVTADGSVHLLTGAGKKAVSYQYRPKGQQTWNKTTIATVDGGLGGLHLAIADGGYVHAAWTTYEQTEQCHYATNAGGDFVIELVATNHQCQLALDNSGAPMLAYKTNEGFEEDLHFVSRGSSGWSTELVASGIVLQSYELLSDQSGAPQLVFWGREDTKSSDETLIWRATRSGNGWAIDHLHTVDTWLLWDSNWLLDDNDVLHGVFTKSGSITYLSYFSLSPAQTKPTVINVVSSLASLGAGGIAIDAQGNAHISYDEHYTLFHGVMAAPNGIDDNCDGTIW